MTHRYYAGRGSLDTLIADFSVDISDVVREVEWLCNREAQAATYYREHPELQYRGHPWLAFVDTGEAAYLGWDSQSSGTRA